MKKTIIKNINMHMKNIGGQTYSNVTARANSTEWIQMSFNMSDLKYSSIIKVKLRLKEYSSSNDDAYIGITNSSWSYSLVGPKLERVVEGDCVYREIDITGLFFVGDFEKYFVIKCNQGSLTIYSDSSSNSSLDRPQIIIEYIDDGESAINQKYIEGNAGNALNYLVNVRTGRPTFLKSLINNPTSVIPFDFGLYFDPLNKDTLNSNMPKGWYFTYNQRVEKDEEEFKYFDSKGLMHRFVKAQDNIYFDISGTCLVLTKNNDGVVIEDGYYNTLTFNHITYENGEPVKYDLTKISKRIPDSGTLKEYALLIEYLSGTNNISSIKELEQGSVVKELVMIDYPANTNKIVISSLGYKSLVLSKDSDGRLVNITEKDERTSTYSYSNGFISSATSDNGETSLFTYNFRGKVLSVTDLISSTSNTKRKYTIEYGYLATYVTDYFNIKKGYTFDEEGTLIGEYEVTGNQYSKSKYLDKKDEGIVLDVNKSDQYIAYNNLTIYGNEIIKNAISIDGDLETNLTDYYRLSFAYKVIGEGTDFSKLGYVRVLQNGVPIKEVALNLRRITEGLFSFMFKFTAVLPITIQFEFNNDSSSYLEVSNIIMTKVSKKECYKCTNKKFINDSTDQFGTGTYTFYPFNKTEYNYNSTSVGTGVMYYEDLIENQKNMALNPTSFHIWYNKKKGLIPNVNSVLLKQNGTYINLNSILCGTAVVEPNQVTLQYTDYENDNVISNQLCKNISKIFVEGSGLFTISTGYVNKFFQTIKSKDSKYMFWSIVTDYVYDKYGNVLSEITSNTGDSKKYVTEYTYNKKILNKKRTYINGVECDTTYTTNSNNGLVNQVKYPDGSVQNITYCPNSNGKFQKLSQTVGSDVNSNELTYNKDKVTNYKGINEGYSLEYDSFNEVSKFKNATSTIWSITRTISPTETVENINYGSANTFKVKNMYDEYGNLVLRQEMSEGTINSDKLRYFYSDLMVDNITATSPTDSSLCKSMNSKLRKIVDLEKSNTKQLYYNDVGNIKKETNTDTINKPAKIEYEYDGIDRLVSKKYNDGTRVEGHEYSFIYGDDIYKYTSKLVQTFNGTTNTINSNVVYEKDYLDRIIKETITTVGNKKLIREFTYVDTNNKATNLIKTIKWIKDSTVVDTLTYTYDKMGRITNVRNTSGDINNTYQYDLFGRLIREDNNELSKAFIYSYDTNGNILSKQTGAYNSHDSSTFTNVALTYSDDYSDELTNFNGKAVTISETGNVTKIGTVTYSWNKEKLLAKVKKNSNQYYDFYYDGMGLRTKKTNYLRGNVTTTEYVYDGSRILSEKITNSSGVKQLDYIYLGNQVIGFAYQNKQYFFQKNLQGDIIKVYDETNTLKASYKYDAWGNCTIVDNVDSIGTLNPFRYKGYYYDSETNLYYCNARYYNPEILRWMSLDSLEYLDESKINGCNLYAYANNNPIFYSYNNVSKKVVSTLSSAVVPTNTNVVSLPSSIGGTANKISTNSLSFSVGLLTPEKYDMPSWMSVYAFYAKGTLGWGYTFGEGYSLASFSTGVLDATFHTPKWFSSLPDDHWANPNIYLGFATWNVNTSIGAGISGTAEIISGTVGIQFGDAISIGVKGYVGIGFTADITNGIKFGMGLGLGYEISLNIDWYELFH